MHYLEKLFLVFSVSNVDFSGNMWMPLKRGGRFLGAEMGMLTWKWTDL